MKILFIYPSNNADYPLQLGALSAFLKRQGHEVRLLMLQIPWSLQEEHREMVRKEMMSFRPDFVGFSCYEMSLPWIDEIGPFLKKLQPGIRIILGGYFPTLAPEKAIQLPYADIICVGEGEEALLELLTSEAGNTQIRSLWFKNGAEVIRNPVRPLIEDLDSLPFPDRDMLDYQAHLNLYPKGDRNLKVMVSRGCPFLCTYCSNAYLKSIYPNKQKYLRMRSPQKVIEEIQLMKSRYEFDTVGFYDDNLTLNQKWLEEFAERYRQEIGLPFYCATRAEKCREDVLSTLKRAGCNLVLIGIESGDEHYRRQRMKRLMSDEQILQAFWTARKVGLRTWAFNMVGLPDETRSSLWKTVWLTWRCRPDFVMASIYYPLRGTELGDWCYENGWVDMEKKATVTSYAWESALKHPNLTSLEIRFWKYANALLACRSSFFWGLLADRLKKLVQGRGRL